MQWVPDNYCAPGERATTFQGDYIIELGSTELVVALFVGPLVKAYEGKNSC